MTLQVWKLFAKSLFLIISSNPDIKYFLCDKDSQIYFFNPDLSSEFQTHLIKLPVLHAHLDVSMSFKTLHSTCLKLNC